MGALTLRLSHGKEGCGFHQLTFHLPQKLSRLHLTGKYHLPWAMMDKGPLSLSSGTLVYTSIPTVEERGSITYVDMLRSFNLGSLPLFSLEELEVISLGSGVS